MNVLLAIVLMRMLLQPLPTGEVANPTADLTERDFPLSGSLRRQLSPRRAFELVLCLLLYFTVNTASNFFYQCVDLPTSEDVANCEKQTLNFPSLSL